jgi:protein-tyrosine phosphatase
MNWANSISSENFEIIHIRDLHDPNDINQKAHLLQFGNHCLVNTKGAEFVFPHSGNELIIDSVGLNDFTNDILEKHLSKFKNEEVRIGIIGVWTEAKVFFLAYDILTRFPNFHVSVCSALTASSSLNNHYASLEQLKRILNVKVSNSIGEFSSYLSWNKRELDIPLSAENNFPSLSFNSKVEISETDLKLIKFVFRNSTRVELSVLDGGFSGNLVLGTKSIDLNGHIEVSHVLKIGEQSLIGKERISFEKVEQVLGNNAPRIIEFADYAGRGILKYRYASMGKGESGSFQKLFIKGLPIEKIKKYLEVLFIDQLGKFYSASNYEKFNLLEYYGFGSVSLDRIKKNIELVYEKDASTEELEIVRNIKSYNPYFFYKNELQQIVKKSNGYAYVSYVHGDLNGANILIDAQENLWIIDFFHTHRGHILKDLIKLENDLLYIWTPINSASTLKEAFKISDVLFNTTDLAEPLPDLDSIGLNDSALKRTYETIQLLRSFYPSLIKSDRNPAQLFVAQLRYAMHTLVFDECNDWQKKWALYNSGSFCKLITERFKENISLRVDFISPEVLKNNFLGITILPGRKDYSRNLDEDIKELKKQNIDVIIPLITEDELEKYGVPDLIKKYHDAGFEIKRLAINDQKTPAKQEVNEIINYIAQKFIENKRVLIHCVGGLGRSGLIAACYLKSIGLNSEDAINSIRETRTVRAIETIEQENFVREYIYN